MGRVGDYCAIELRECAHRAVADAGLLLSPYQKPCVAVPCRLHYFIVNEFLACHVSNDNSQRCRQLVQQQPCQIFQAVKLVRKLRKGHSTKPWRTNHRRHRRRHNRLPVCATAGVPQLPHTHLQFLRQGPSLPVIVICSRPGIDGVVVVWATFAGVAAGMYDGWLHYTVGGWPECSQPSALSPGTICSDVDESDFPILGACAVSLLYDQRTE